MNKPLLSIIIPFKNEEHTLPFVLDSLYIQESDFSFEVILADGCSTDSSVRIIEEHQLFKKTDVKIISLPPENHGMTVARNAGAKDAHGKYFIFMQADIRINDKKALSKVVDAFKDPEVVGTSFVALGADSEFDKYDFWGKVLMARFQKSRDKDNYDTKFNGVRKDIFQKMNGFDEERYPIGGEDFDFFVRLAALGRIAKTGVEVEHLHGYGSTQKVGPLLKKYCRNAEVAGATTPDYIKHSHLRPMFYPQLFLKWLLCFLCIASFVPFTWPWTPILVLFMGLFWSRYTFLYVRDWKLIFIPFFSVVVMYCFTFYFLKGRLAGKTTVQINSTEGGN